MASKLPALEKNILKFRALQMVLLLHQVESLRAFIIGSIRATDKMRNGQPMLPLGAKRPMQKALEVLVARAVISSGESEDLQKIVDLRNKIGHTIHELVMDISPPKFLIHRDTIYDYFALERFEKYRDKIDKGMKDFVYIACYRDIAFENAESAYKEELTRLHNRIERQYSVRMQNLARASGKR